MLETMYTFFKFETSGLSLYLSKFILEGNHSYNTGFDEGGLSIYHCRTDVFKYSFFPYIVYGKNEYLKTSVGPACT